MRPGRRRSSSLSAREPGPRSTLTRGSPRPAAASMRRSDHQAPGLTPGPPGPGHNGRSPRTRPDGVRSAAARPSVRPLQTVQDGGRAISTHACPLKRGWEPILPYRGEEKTYRDPYRPVAPWKHLGTREVDTPGFFS